MAKHLGEDVEITFEQECPKKRGSAAADRYDKYKSAKTVGEALRLGANKGDIQNDKGKGYLKVAGEANAPGPAVAAAAPRAGERPGNGGGAVQKAKEKKKKDANAPKKPTGGGYMLFLQEKRPDIIKALPADHKITDVTKAAGEQWGALSDEAKKPYNDKYAKNLEKYKVELAEYRKNHPADSEAEEAEEDTGPKVDADAKAKAKVSVKIEQGAPVNRVEHGAPVNRVSSSSNSLHRRVASASAIRFDDVLFVQDLRELQQKFEKRNPNGRCAPLIRAMCDSILNGRLDASGLELAFERAIKSLAITGSSSASHDNRHPNLTIKRPQQPLPPWMQERVAVAKGPGMALSPGNPQFPPFGMLPGAKVAVGEGGANLQAAILPGGNRQLGMASDMPHPAHQRMASVVAMANGGAGGASVFVPQARNSLESVFAPQARSSSADALLRAGVFGPSAPQARNLFEDASSPQKRAAGEAALRFMQQVGNAAVHNPKEADSHQEEKRMMKELKEKEEELKRLKKLQALERQKEQAQNDVAKGMRLIAERAGHIVQNDAALKMGLFPQPANGLAPSDAGVFGQLGVAPNAPNADRKKVAPSSGGLVGQPGVAPNAPLCKDKHKKNADDEKIKKLLDLVSEERKRQLSELIEKRAQNDAQPAGQMKPHEAGERAEPPSKKKKSVSSGEEKRSQVNQIPTPLCKNDEANMWSKLFVESPGQPDTVMSAPSDAIHANPLSNSSAPKLVEEPAGDSAMSAASDSNPAPKSSAPESAEEPAADSAMSAPSDMNPPSNSSASAPSDELALPKASESNPGAVGDDEMKGSADASSTSQPSGVDELKGSSDAPSASQPAGSDAENS